MIREIALEAQNQFHHFATFLEIDTDFALSVPRFPQHDRRIQAFADALCQNFIARTRRLQDILKRSLYRGTAPDDPISYASAARS